MEKTKTYCSSCENETNHEVLFSGNDLEPKEIIKRNESGDKNESAWIVAANIWQLSKCLGCDKLTFKHILRTSPDIKHDRISYFPKKEIRRVPRWTLNLPLKYIEILNEVYISINSEISIVALIGIRTILDIFIVDKIGDQGSFKQKLIKLVSEGIITQSKADVLEVAIDAGNASAHRGYKPEKEILFKIMDIVENLLKSEIVDREAILIKEKTPNRQNRNNQN